jgi:hypothetical protein
VCTVSKKSIIRIKNFLRKREEIQNAVMLTVKGKRKALKTLVMPGFQGFYPVEAMGLEPMTSRV